MGASWSVTLVSCDGEEIQVAVDVLCSASVVWRDRLQLAGTLSPPPRSEENCSAEEIRAFICVISSRSVDATTTVKEIPIDTILKSLPLVHKYDCSAIKIMLDEVDGLHFPDHKMVVSQGVGREARTFRIVNERQTIFSPLWLTQAHVDYLILKQELYGDDAAFTDTMKRLLAKLLTTKDLYCGLHFDLHDLTTAIGVPIELPRNVTDKSKMLFKVHLVKPSFETSDSTDACEKEGGPKALELHAYRLTSSLYCSIMPVMAVQN